VSPLEKELALCSQKMPSSLSNIDESSKVLINYVLGSCFLDEAATKRSTSMKGLRVIPSYVYKCLAELKSPDCDVFIAGGFASYVLGNTENFGDIDVYLIGTSNAQKNIIDRLMASLSKVEIIADEELGPCKVRARECLNMVQKRLEYCESTPSLDKTLENVIWIEVYGCQVQYPMNKNPHQEFLLVNVIQTKYSEPSKWISDNIAKITDTFDLNICRAVLWNILENGPTHGIRLDNGNDTEQTLSVLIKEQEMRYRERNIKGSIYYKVENQYFNSLDRLVARGKRYSERRLKQFSPDRLERLCLGSLFWKVSGEALHHHVLNSIAVRAGMSMLAEERANAMISKFYPWQKDLFDYISYKSPHERAIIWIYDPVGKTGKTEMGNTIKAKIKKTLLENTKYLNDLELCAKGRIIKVLILDLHDICLQHNPINFANMEYLKELHRPHIVVFSRFLPFSWNELSLDRWVIGAIDAKDKTMKMYTVPDVRCSTKSTQDLHECNFFLLSTDE